MALLNAADNTAHHSSAGNPKEHRTHTLRSAPAHINLYLLAERLWTKQTATQRMIHSAILAHWQAILSAPQRSHWCVTEGHLWAPPSQPKISSMHNRRSLQQQPPVASAWCASLTVSFHAPCRPRRFAAPNENSLGCQNSDPNPRRPIHNLQQLPGQQGRGQRVGRAWGQPSPSAPQQPQSARAQSPPAAAAGWAPAAGARCTAGRPPACARQRTSSAQPTDMSII